MRTVTLAYAIEHEGKTRVQTLIGIGESPEKAIDLIKKSGFGFNVTDEEFALLAINEQIAHPTDMNTFLKIETWQVH